MTITDIIDNEHKCIVELELDEDFEKGFMQVHKLKKWDKNKFSSWFRNILWRALLTIEKGGYDTIYHKSESIGVIKDAEPQDVVTFWKKVGGVHTRVIAKIHKNHFMTESLWETEKPIKVIFTDVVRIVRKLD
jgi:hypothetical protein